MTNSEQSATFASCNICYWEVMCESGVRFCANIDTDSKALNLQHEGNEVDHSVNKHIGITVNSCCCIMNEVDICVTTKQSVTASGSPYSPRRRAWSSRGKWTQRVVVDIYGRNGERQTSMQKEEEMDIEYLPDDSDIILSEEEMEEEEEEEEGDIFESPQQSSSPQGATSSSPTSTDPISIPSPLGQSPLSPGCSFVTPSHCSSSSIMRRFSPMGSWEAVSPMSSGYGSAPRFFSSIGTQTPPATPVFFETRIQLQFGDSHSQDLRLRQRLVQQDNVRTRFYSEGSAREAASAREGAQELPDLVLDRTFRDRANSAPSRPSQSAIEVGRELRRISDEFESTFYQQRGRSNSILRRLVGLLNRDQGAEERQNQDHRPNAIGSGGGL
ncbi:uncharacterized protein [Apostichopus japonicus]|uniref:uncharacterized protein isoform X3 n=1 Tax=Stichopus japonicus TaxID=307972 RepID=UPI003AB75322